MKHLNIVAALIVALALLFAIPAYAQTEKGKLEKGKPENTMQDPQQDVADRAEMERDKLSKQDKAMREKVKDPRSEKDLDDADPKKGHENAATRGNENAQEMRARRDERKTIKEEYKADRKSDEPKTDLDDGEVGAAVDGLTESDEESKGQEKKAKKPWWKFWDE